MLYHVRVIDLDSAVGKVIAASVVALATAVVTSVYHSGQESERLLSNTTELQQLESDSRRLSLGIERLEALRAESAENVRKLASAIESLANSVAELQGRVSHTERLMADRDTLIRELHETTQLARRVESEQERRRSKVDSIIYLSGRIDAVVKVQEKILKKLGLWSPE